MLQKKGSEAQWWGKDGTSAAVAVQPTSLLCRGCHILVSEPWRGQKGFLEEREGAVAHREPVCGGLELWEPVPPKRPS